mmetsp:Transcript_7453/g.8521  ORF Transcript_7453/g.8521 Transcript_7453/m.8521 type:complete len:462 (-) Transcript_7453:237-1622(-)
MVDAGERLQVLLTQEATIYQTTDYLTRMNGVAKLQEMRLEQQVAAANVAAAKQHQCLSSSSSGESSSPPSSPNKRKSWDELTSVEEEDSNSSSSSSARHTEQCRRTAATTCASSVSSTGAGTGGAGSGSGSGRSVGSSSTSTSSQINKHWREKICEWAYQVVDHFDLNREVVGTAMSHLDRYLGIYNGTVDKNLFQLLAMTCLYLSIKLNEYKHLLIPGSKSSMDTILQLSRGFFTLEEMEKMEYDILQRLRWHVHPPTAQIFMKHFLFFLSGEEKELDDLAQFMIELSVMDYFFVSYKPSEIALAALLNSMDRLGSQTRQIHFPFNCNFVDMHSPAVRACRERLSLIYAQANEQGGVDEAVDEATPAKAEPPADVPEPSQLERTISPVSVMSPYEPDDDVNTTKTITTTANYGCSTASQQQQQQQQQQYHQSFHSTAAYDNNMDTDDGYFFDETEVECRM